MRSNNLKTGPSFIESEPQGDGNPHSSVVLHNNTLSSQSVSLSHTAWHQNLLVNTPPSLPPEISLLFHHKDLRNHIKDAAIIRIIIPCNSKPGPGHHADWIGFNEMQQERSGFQSITLTAKGMVRWMFYDRISGLSSAKVGNCGPRVPISRTRSTNLLGATKRCRGAFTDFQSILSTRTCCFLFSPEVQSKPGPGRLGLVSMDWVRPICEPRVPITRTRSHKSTWAPNDAAY